ncbi:porin [Nonlabens sp. Hel1_33_55]|uniref:porin n=1 Tax=Nonlabens sp. Hel1_33_55 TaxID=1336802 RepID=UPI0012FE3C92|nr:porin [Nonlabens sp. Hel1_33_55]
MNFKQLFIALSMLGAYGVMAQPTTLNEGKEITSGLTISGSGQIWMRYSDLNPGSRINDNPVDHVYDISIRRYRLSFKGRASENINFALLIGNNNLNLKNPDTPPTILEMYMNYKFSDKLIITAGKSGWTGLSRYAAPSSSNSLGLDVNFAAGPLLNFQDDRYRKYSIAAHGISGKLDYRAVIAKPVNTRSNSVLTDDAKLVYNPNSLYTSAYVKYQFLENEPSTPFSAGTFLGTKDILNVGVGFLNQTKSAASLSVQNDTLTHAARSFAIDAFYEQKLTNNHSWTLYAAYLNHDIGPNYVRNLAADNVVDAGQSSSFNGVGNAVPVNGTGNIFVLQAGYLQKLEGEAPLMEGIQPFVTAQYLDLDAFDDPVMLYEGGISFLLRGHNSKFVFGYQNWPVIMKDMSMKTTRNSMAVLMYQFKFN